MSALSTEVIDQGPELMPASNTGKPWLLIIKNSSGPSLDIE